ncbi:MAG: hypothetical protein E5Y58_27880 [Mesorhizobium sp.]|nr:MAG: hypothetical protein E5Y58_27880 [Mesorhizobium sp.]
MDNVRSLLVFGMGVIAGVLSWNSLMVAAAAQGPGRYAVVKLNGGVAENLQHSLNAMPADFRLIAVTSDGGDTFAIVER